MTNIVQSSLATLQVQVPISAVLNGTVSYDPTGDVVAMAFMAPGATPGSSDWHTGSWTTAPGPVYLAQCLVGPSNGGVPLAGGVYAIWVKVTDNPEIFIPPGGVGTLTIE